MRPARHWPRSCALPAIGPARALPAIGPARVHRPPAPFSDVPLGRARSSAHVQVPECPLAPPKSSFPSTTPPVRIWLSSSPSHHPDDLSATTVRSPVHHHQRLCEQLRKSGHLLKKPLTPIELQTVQGRSSVHERLVVKNSDDEVEADEDEEEAPEPEEEDSGEDEFTDELRSSEFNSRDS
ncbi:hypothetical protein GPALN_014393, partial [Globodera pallida]